VFCSTLTFVAAANAIVYQGGAPVFLDSDRATWNLDPEVLSRALRARAAVNRLPKALVVVHLYGHSADMDPILQTCAQYGVAVIEDAAEAVGTLYKGRPAGTLGEIGVYSFNGNKIVTTTGGGMLVSRHAAWVAKAGFWSQQARDPGLAYYHSELGYNYRMSNVLAGIGRGQLVVLEQRVAQRRAVAQRYREAFADVPGIELMPQASFGRHTNWLSCFQIDPRFVATRDELITALTAQNIEARPVWKPMHLQPVFADAECIGGAVAEELFTNGICLPSSSSLTADEQRRVVDVVRAVHRTAATAEGARRRPERGSPGAVGGASNPDGSAGSAGPTQAG
jgi:pyridoxal phosphate-dependent aminotransferase EpsN